MAAGFQPRMVPASVANMKSDFTPGATSKPFELLNTVPVGAPGTDTTSGAFMPVAMLYSVDTSAPLSDTHHGLVALALSPHGFTSCGSLISAGTDPSDTMLCC